MLVSMASEFFVWFCMGEEKDAQRLTIENSTTWGATECLMACQDIPSITRLWRQGHHSLVQPQKFSSSSRWHLQPCTKLSFSSKYTITCLSAPGYRKPVSMSLPHELQLSLLLGRCLGWALLLVTTRGVCDFSLATCAGIWVQTRLLNFLPLKCYNFNEHNYKRIQYSAKFSASHKLILNTDEHKSSSTICIRK